MSNQHVLKIHPAPLADLLSGAKTAEVRRNDRGFQVGDTVRLMEVNPETGNWTGAADHVRTISHIQTGYGLPDGLCVLSYAQAEQQEAQGAQAGDRQAKPGLYCRNCGSRLMVKDVCSIYCPNKNCERDRAALATQPAASEPAAWECFDGRYASLSYEREGDPERAVPLFRGAPPAAAHGDEAVRKDVTESAIQRACGVLPEGWSMQIDLERDAGWVTLFNPWGRAVDFGQDFGSIGAHVEAAIDAAMLAQAGEGGE